MSDDQLWSLMFGPAIDRLWQVLSNGHCPACRKGVPMCRWKTDPLAYPWKMSCPRCAEHPDPKDPLHMFGVDDVAAANSAVNVWACLCGPHLEGPRHLVAHCSIERLLWVTDVTSLAIPPYLYRDPLMGRLHLAPAQARAIDHANPQRWFALEDREDAR